MGEEPMSFEAFRRSFSYGDRSDMQFKFLAGMGDEAAADTVAEVLARVGEALDTGALTGVRDAVYAAQVAAYQADDTPVVDDAPFTPLPAPLADLRLALVSAGGVFRADDDPMGPDGPTQAESLGLIKDFLRGAPTLSVIPKNTPDSALTARHPGYDALTAQRDPGTVFPLAVLRELESEGSVQLADIHYAFTGATSQVRLRTQVAPEWADRLVADGVDACLLVAT
ncbi:selenoprotein B, glycine/betaine/sarcosine/D-proline reductase family [Modestobacter sp. DSM 44400]|uniref:glycine/sarcosine/betaine reductase selenoprotein B family protein n=1 Tax=Modestobacter sp. DSM 44400 TaxID=1550230 RepID=UPI00089762A7|nr:glycine/sarcosine/betaine reductase selenoprotein B family protein [Modestobacter sp. DSM 44400]SDX98986.1 selenoprotein B, glycine/betaine/sarcosine/D-proline reductase family [Modestobacter sp. DSM 44400]